MEANVAGNLVADGLLQYSGGKWELVGSRCTDCGEYFFPAQAGCAQCSGTNLNECAIGNRGILWSWTVQGFMPKFPYDSGETDETFKPYGVGYVQMPAGIKIETRLTTADPSQLEIGIPVELVLEPYRTTESGEPVYTFAFAPASDVNSSTPTRGDQA